MEDVKKEGGGEGINARWRKNNRAEKGKPNALSKGKPLECSSRSLVVLSIEKGDDKIEHC